MIVSWRCEQCGWMNDNNAGDCRRCGGNTEFQTVRGRTKEVITKQRDEAKIAAFDALLEAQRSNRDGGRYDRR